MAEPTKRGGEVIGCCRQGRVIPWIVLALACGSSPPTTTEDPFPPGAHTPRNLRIDRLIHSYLFWRLDLQWDQPTGHVSNYVVETRIPGVFDWTAVNDTPLVPAETALSLIYPDDQVPELVTASFRVGGNLYPKPTEYSNEVQQPFALRPPADLSALMPEIGGNGFLLQWRNVSEKAEQVVIERETVLPESADHGWTVVGSVATPATQFVDLSFPDASRVKYRVRAVKGADTSEPTETRNSGLFDTPPRPPANFSATGIADGIELSWINRSVMATELVLFRASADATDFKQLELVHLPADSTSYVDLPPEPGAYGYWLEARGPELLPGADSTATIGYLPPAHDPSFRATVPSLPFWTGDPVTDTEGRWILCGAPGVIQPPVGPPSDFSGTGWATPCASAAADGTLHGVFVDGMVLRHMTYAGGAWSRETITTDPIGFITAAQVLDAQGRLVVAWIDANAQLWFARQAPTGWSPELVPGVVASPVSLRMTLDLAGDPHLSVRDGLRVLHVTRSGGGSWTVESLLPDGILTGALDAWILSGGGGDLEILFSARASGPDQLLALDRSGGAWTGPTTVGPVVRMRAAGSPDHRRAAVLIEQPDRLRLREWVQDHWSETALDVPEVDPGAAGFDGSNRLHLLVPAGPRNWAVIDEVP